MEWWKIAAFAAAGALFGRSRRRSVGSGVQIREDWLANDPEFIDDLELAIRAADRRQQVAS